MKIFLICVTVTLFLSVQFFAEGQESFVRTVQGGDYVPQAIQTSDGNYASLSGVDAFGGNEGQYFLRKMTASGKRIWEKAIFFDIHYGYAVLTGVAETNDGFVLSGYTWEGYYYSTSRGVLIKLDLEGRLQWSKAIPGGIVDGFRSVHATTDGFKVTGASDLSQYPILIKFDTNGSVVWSKSFNTVGHAFQSISTSDGTLLASSIMNSEKSIGTNVVKIDGSGNVVWAVSLLMEDFSLRSLTALSDGGFVVGGTGNKSKVQLVTLNASGTLRNKSAFSLSASEISISSIAETRDGGLAIAGVMGRKSAPADGFLLITDKDRRLRVRKRLGFQESNELITSVIAKEDHGYLLTGSLKSDVMLLALNKDGGIPGCKFSTDFKAKKVSFGKLDTAYSSITTQDLLIPAAGTLDVQVKPWHRRNTEACVQ